MNEQEKLEDKADKEVKSIRVEPDIKTDTFSIEEQEKIVRMVKQDLDADLISMGDWIEQRKKDLQMYESERPSLIEDLDKEEWMSDRNLGVTAATCDTYQATLLSTCYNIDTINFTATEFNDVDRKDQLIKFTKWGLGKQEADFFPEVDDFIHNKITQGISYFYIYWDVWYEWIDRRIPVYKDERLVKYKIETEYKRFERGCIENISDVSDLIFPAHGNTLQEKAHLIHRIHKTAKDIIDFGERGVFVDVTEEYAIKLRKHCYDNRLSLLRVEKAENLGIKTESDVQNDTLRMFPVDLYAWYGKYKKDGKEEEYRFIIEPQTMKFLSGKPLRKITRSGKRPFVGSPFIRRPGFVQGNSLPHLIADPTNALNNSYNQKSDFQYVENCPFGWYNPDEGFKSQEHKIKPGVLLPTSDPQSVTIPNISRSLAWAQSDFALFFEVIEKLTGAASYFMSNNRGTSGTATRDAIINQKSETRFGLWVNRIIDDMCEAIDMWIQMYQDWAPPDLGDRVLGEDGKKLFTNLSIETLRGGYDSNITPDIISGSKSLEKENAIWALGNLAQSPWFNPQINPRGSWSLTNWAAKKVGIPNVDRLMPPEPPPMPGDTKLIKDKWTQLKQGQIPTIEPTDDVTALYMGFIEIAQTKREELDKEYIPNLDLFMFQLNVAMQKEMQRVQQEQVANQMAMGIVKDVQEGRLKKEEVINA